MSTRFAPADTEPHALVRGTQPGHCATCGHVYQSPVDPIHSLPGVCDRCGATTPPLRTTCDACNAQLRAEGDRAWSERMAGYGKRKPEPRYLPEDDAESTSGTGGHQAPDMSPEAVAERARLKQRQAEALRYVADYRGTWGLPLDIRSDPKWGTKWHRLSIGQVDALLAGKARDAARLDVASDPRQVAARAWLLEQPAPRVEGFMSSMMTRAAGGLGFSEKQLEVVERIRDETQRPAPIEGWIDTAAATPANRTVSEGWYTVDSVPWKVQKALHGSHNLYAKRLEVVGTSGRWEYVPGGLRTIAEKGEPMTVEQAKAFGHLYGICGVCGRRLTDERSIADGIGPICSGRLS